MVLSHYDYSFASGGVSPPSIVQCSFIDDASPIGGGVYVISSFGTSDVLGTFLIDGCTFNGGEASMEGGAVALSTVDSPSVVTNSTFSANTASVAGGAIYTFEASDVNITLVNMSENKAGKGGG